MHDPLSSDITILDLLRKRSEMTISEFSDVMEVTATAVRQRLNRLMAQGLVGREATRRGRGRPQHRYSLTSKGRRQSGANFADLAIALWREVRAVKDLEVRRGLLQRIAAQLASIYAKQIQGNSPEEKMRSIASLFEERKVPFSVEKDGGLPVLTVMACPYPELADEDRTVCSMERLLFSELLGQNVHLSNCRLDGADCCKFEVN